MREFVAPDESLEETLESNRGQHLFHQGDVEEEPVTSGNSTFYLRTHSMTENISTQLHGIYLQKLGQKISLILPQPH